MPQAIKLIISSAAMYLTASGPSATPAQAQAANVKAQAEGVAQPQAAQSFRTVGGDGSSAVKDFNGNYAFAPIHEWQTAKAMTSRYFDDMMNAAVSDVIIIGAGSAGLSCAYKLGKARPDLNITILEASVAPGSSMSRSQLAMVTTAQHVPVL